MKKIFMAVIALIGAIIVLKIAFWVVKAAISVVFIISGVVLLGLVAIPIYLYFSKKLLK